MENIKFRVWDKILKGWIIEDTFLDNKGNVFILRGKVGVILNGNDWEINLYTGFIDKNGKEIYEKDILQDNFGNKLIVYYQDGMFVVGNMKNSKFFMEGILNQYVKIEIIGNVYQNSNLLYAK
jgi:hypothetical protein